MERFCLDCGKVLRGRSDKKFCDDDCRNSYNNRHNRDEIAIIRNIHNVLRRNRRILAELNSSQQTKVHRDQLITRGYNFDFHTQTTISQAGKISFYCYEQGLTKIDEEYFQILFNEENPI